MIEQSQKIYSDVDNIKFICFQIDLYRFKLENVHQFCNTSKLNN